MSIQRVKEHYQQDSNLWNDQPHHVVHYLNESPFSLSTIT